MKLGKLSRKATAAAIGGALALTGVGVGTAAVLSSPDTRPVSEQTEVTPSEEAAPTDVAEPTRPQPVAEQPEQAAPTSSVATVTSSQKRAPAAEPDPAGTGIGTTGPDGQYTPAPPPERPGQPPMGSIAPEAPAPKMPGEPGYVPPAG